MVKNGPLVSVIIPVYNHEKYISEAIESVLNQTFKDIELIIIDDASNDSSKEIIQLFEKKSVKIKSFFHKKNMGIAKTVNECIEIARGKYISHFSSDDVWFKEKLEKQLEILRKDEDLIIWSEGLIINTHGNPTGELFTQKHDAIKRKKSGNIFEELLKGNYICGQSLIYKKENFKDVRLDDKLKYLNDYKFMVDLAKKHEFYFISEPLVMYRIHGENSILLDKKGWQNDNIKIKEYFLREYDDEISNKIKNKIMLSISRTYLNIGKRENAKQYFFHAVKLDPFCLSNLIPLAIILTKKNGIIRNFLKWNYRNYRKVKNIFNL